MLVNISGTETQNEIAGLEHVSDSPVDPFQTGFVADTAMSVRNDFVSDQLSGHSWNRRFMRSINIRYHHVIRIIERATKFLPQCFCARITVRLKHCEHALAPDRSGRLERGADFRRVMSVIVHQKKSRAVVLDFEPAARVLKLCQRFRDFFKSDAEL